MTNRRLIFRVLLYLIAGLGLASMAVPFPLQAQDPEEYAPLINDALTRPLLRGELMAQQEGGRPGYRRTSEYMAGRVAVGIILPESNGAVDPSSEDWTDSQIAEIEAEIVGALNWWAKMLPGAGLSFTYELHARVPTSHEPITHTLDEEGLWISEAMAALGYEGVNHFERVYEYLNTLRQTHAADWAFAVFVANSAADADGKLRDQRFAYAYFGGPFAVLTYDNNGYGITNMDGVLAHEMGHIFWALDQYTGARVSCDTRSGYLDIPTYNSQYDGSCPLDVPSIMRGGTGPYAEHAIDRYALGQVGYWDSDGDGLPDPLDTIPSLALSPTSPDDEGRMSYAGTAEDVPWSSAVHPDATINTIVAVEYRLDGGPWQPAGPADGEFDSFWEPFTFIVAPGRGSHTVEVRAVNSVGNFSEILSDTMFIGAQPVSTPTPLPDLPTLTPSPIHTPEPLTPVPSPTGTPEPPAPTPTPLPTRDSRTNVEINNDAAYTNRITVTLQIQPPPEAMEMEVSNDPHFSPALLLPVSSVTTWVLEHQGTGGLRTVYVRFKDGDGRYSASYEDSITLDVQPPTGSISVRPQGEGELLLHLPAFDDLSGVQQMHLGAGEELQEADWIDYQPTFELPDEGGRTVFVRYRDGAGNVSDSYGGINPAHLELKVYLPLFLSAYSR